MSIYEGFDASQVPEPFGNDPEIAPDADATLLQDGEMLAFLMGTGPLEGHHFGERHGTHKGAFWWRTVIRERQITRAPGQLAKEPT